MRILYFFTFGYSLQTWDKSGTLLKELKLYQELYNNYNIETLFITYGDEKDCKIIDEFDGLSVIPINKYLKKFDNKFLSIIQSFFIPIYLKFNFDLKFEIIKQNQLLGSWVSILTKIIFRKPLIIRSGYDMLFFATKEKKSKLKIIGYYLLTYFSLLFANIYTVTTKQDKEYLSKKFNMNWKVKIIPNWVFTKDNPKILEKRKSSFLTVGRLESQKNYIQLLENLSNFQYEIDIVGEGSLKKEISEIAEKIGVQVNFLGNYKYFDLLKVYENYKFFILPSNFEGNPKVILEAMSIGCIVFANNIPHHKEIISNNVNGILFDFETQNLNLFIEEVCLNRKLIKTISSNAIKSIKENNSLEKIMKLTVEDINFLVNKN